MTVPEKQNKARLLAPRPAKPNALKHGAFSSIELLPWEDADAFEQLRQELWNEHTPEGPSQEDAVETIPLVPMAKIASALEAKVRDGGRFEHGRE